MQPLSPNGVCAYVFGGEIAQQVDPVRVAGDGAVLRDLDPGSRLDGGFTVLEPSNREEALRCAQELRECLYDPAS